MIRQWTGQNTSGFAVFSRQQARQFDAWAIQTLGIPSAVLMENAARGVVEALTEHLRFEIKKVFIFCGNGNNGGDGLAIGRWFYNLDIESHIYLTSPPDLLSADAAVQYRICQKLGLPIVSIDPQLTVLKEFKEKFEPHALIVDALFGTGLCRPLSEPYIELIRQINDFPYPKIAVDIPSGLDCDTGLPLPTSVQAQATITFGGLKKGFVENPDSRRYLGKVFVASIGVKPPPTA